MIWHGDGVLILSCCWRRRRAEALRRRGGLGPNLLFDYSFYLLSLPKSLPKAAASHGDAGIACNFSVRILAHSYL